MEQIESDQSGWDNDGKKEKGLDKEHVQLTRGHGHSVGTDSESGA